MVLVAVVTEEAAVEAASALELAVLAVCVA
jgi:hypothetical protein